MSKWFGTTRTALSGGNSKQTRSDTLHDRLYVECKYGKDVAPWTLYLDAAEKAQAEGKIPVLALKRKGEEGFLLCMRERDLLAVAEVRELVLWGDAGVDVFDV